MNDEEGLHICWLIEDVDKMIGMKESNGVSVPQDRVRVFDIMREKVVIVNEKCISKLKDWREHRL